MQPTEVAPCSNETRGLCNAARVSIVCAGSQPSSVGGGFRPSSVCMGSRVNFVWGFRRFAVLNQGETMTATPVFSEGCVWGWGGREALRHRRVLIEGPHNNTRRL